MFQMNLNYCNNLLIGYLGSKCEDICPEGFYGQSCLQICNCVSSNAVCHPAKGCLCKSGFGGDSCSEPITQESKYFK